MIIKMEFNNKLDSDFNIFMSKAPNIPVPKRRIKDIQIRGRDGTLTEDEETYEDIEIEVEYKFIDYYQLKQRLRKIKPWIKNITNNQLKFSDEADLFYRVKYSDLKIETEKRNTAVLSITFKCEPYAYVDSDEIEITNNTTLENYHEKALPIIYIEGEGASTLTINDNTLTLNIGQNLTINSELKIAYREDGTIQNSSFKGDYPVLVPGTNNISWTGNITKVKILPNWRCI